MATGTFSLFSDFLRKNRYNVKIIIVIINYTFLIEKGVNSIKCNPR